MTDQFITQFKSRIPEDFSVSRLAPAEDTYLLELARHVVVSFHSPVCFKRILCFFFLTIGSSIREHQNRTATKQSHPEPRKTTKGRGRLKVQQPWPDFEPVVKVAKEQSRNKNQKGQSHACSIAFSQSCRCPRFHSNQSKFRCLNLRD